MLCRQRCGIIQRAFREAHGGKAGRHVKAGGEIEQKRRRFRGRLGVRAAICSPDGARGASDCGNRGVGIVVHCMGDDNGIRFAVAEAPTAAEYMAQTVMKCDAG